MPSSNAKQLQTLRTSDGFALATTRFPAQAPLRGRIVIAGATAVPQRFYGAFAAFAAEHGYETTTLDYRGIGRSKPRSLQGFSASFVDWGRLDLAAVVASLPEDGKPLFLVAHSFGGHALGFLPNHTRITASWMCGVGAGWHGWMPPLERLRVWTLWNVVLPPLVATYGYLPWSQFGMGEDLPRGVYRQWRRWCQYPHYFLDDPEATALKEQCALVQTPILALNAPDDAWASACSRDAFLQNAYPKATLERAALPTELGAIGHMGYFRSQASSLWSQPLTWFESFTTPHMA